MVGVPEGAASDFGLAGEKSPLQQAGGGNFDALLEKYKTVDCKHFHHVFLDLKRQTMLANVRNDGYGFLQVASAK